MVSNIKAPTVIEMNPIDFMSNLPKLLKPTDIPSSSPNISSKPPPSYVKLAMRNMVYKRGTSIKHFIVTTVGLLGFLIGISYLTR